jgi:hypothetical protein
MKSIYLVVEYEGIYEIIRLDGERTVVQTNIRTAEKAIEACRTWQNRELKNNLLTNLKT